CAALGIRLLLDLPIDLHVFGLPLAFILSQDHTLHCNLSLLSITERPKASQQLPALFLRLSSLSYNISKNLLPIFIETSETLVSNASAKIGFCFDFTNPR
ncbi:hypothetical protein, partial [Algoriphagus sp.]|uniref:hypothetical protein n=1 Tax=Algoriphagus sp. TaxID=1872435 RepID=UPI002731BDB3